MTEIDWKVLRVPKETHQAVKTLAAAMNVEMNELVTDAVGAYAAIKGLEKVNLIGLGLHPGPADSDRPVSVEVEAAE